MDLVKNAVYNFDYKSIFGKLLITFVLSALLFSAFAPGVFFEVDLTSETQKISQQKKIELKVSIVHGIIFGAILTIFIYFYIIKLPTTSSSSSSSTLSSSSSSSVHTNQK